MLICHIFLVFILFSNIKHINVDGNRLFRSIICINAAKFTYSVFLNLKWPFLLFVVLRHFKPCAQLFSVTNCPIKLKLGTITDDINILKFTEGNFKTMSVTMETTQFYAFFSENAIIYQT